MGSWRLLQKWLQRTGRPLVRRSFRRSSNEESQQRQDFANLAEQDELLLLFYDEALSERRRITMRPPGKDTSEQLLCRLTMNDLGSTITSCKLYLKRVVKL